MNNDATQCKTALNAEFLFERPKRSIFFKANSSRGGSEGTAAAAATIAAAVVAGAGRRRGRGRCGSRRRSRRRSRSRRGIKYFRYHLLGIAVSQ